MIASDIREKLVDLGLPDRVEVARKSTICALRFSGIYESDYADQISGLAEDISRTLKVYIEFLENSLSYS